jgi:hypothetical protein
MSAAEIMDSIMIMEESLKRNKIQNKETTLKTGNNKRKFG